MSSVVVLAPNGRRQNVKVTPDTTILQILEEVCKKQGYKPEEFDIRHHNHVVDPSTIIRFSGLPNNAQLEMAPATKKRAESSVVVGVQLEDGTRLTDNFTPSDTIWNVLVKLCPGESNIETNPVVIYMRREVYGLLALQNTTLRSLGLTSGRAMLRLIHRTPDELHTQANVSAPLPSRPVEEKPYRRVLQQSDSPPEDPSLTPDSSKHSTESSQSQTDSQDSLKSQPKPETSQTKTRQEREIFLAKFIKQEKERKEQPAVDKLEPMETDPGCSKNHDVFDKVALKNQRFDDVAFLGERNALAFSLETASAVPQEDLPDEFFELTTEDARKLLRDLRRKRIELEETPLQTSAVRSLEDSKKVLRHLNQYKKSVLRIQFPDRTVLQGTFTPLETVSAVMEFVKGFLAKPATKFYLYTTPPKSVLNPDTRLVDASCVPTALLHFGTYDHYKERSYLREDILTRFTSPSVASLAASQTRKTFDRTIPEPSQTMDLDESVPATTNAVASGSVDYNSQPSTSRYRKPDGKVPKWFQSSKK